MKLRDLFNFTRKEQSQEEKRSHTYGGPVVANWDSSFGAGKDIDRLSVVYGCVNLRASTIASLPIQLNRKLGRGHEAATDHPYYNLITKNPNQFQTPFNLWQWAVIQLDLFGNCYIQKLRKQDGTIAELIPLNPTSVEVEIKPDGLPYYKMYLVNFENTSYLREFTSDQIIHIKGYSRNGVFGMSVIEAFRQLFDGYTELEKAGTQIAKNAAKPGGVVYHPANMKEEELQKLKQSWSAGFSGTNSGKTAFIPNTFKTENLASGLTAQDAEYVNQKSFNAQRIVADLFGCPLYKFGLQGGPTYASVEQQAIEFVQYTLSPIITNIEQTIQKQLLENDDDVYINFDLKGLLRGDARTRVEYYRFMWEHGAMTPNQIHEEEDTGITIPADKGGDSYYVPLNFASAAKGPVSGSFSLTA